MMHDPFQTYSMLGAYPGTTAALGLNPAALNPLAGGISPFGIQQGIGGLIPQLHQQQLQQQILQQQLQLAAILTQNPQLQGLSQLGVGLHNPLAAIALLQNPLLQNPLLQNPLLQNPLLQNPLLQNPLLHNPLVTQLLQNPLVNPVLAQHYQTQFPQISYGGSPFGQIGSPLGQIGSPFGQIGYPLAPQSWIGQQGLGVGSPFAQGHPLLSQLAGRGIQGHGFSPWSGI